MSIAVLTRSKMATSEMTALLICWIVVGCIGIAETSIACYSCDTNYLPQSTLAFNCNDTLRPDGVPTCNGASCGKRLYNCTGTDEECAQQGSRRGTIVRRYCSDQVVASDICNSTMWGDKAIETVCLCNSDKCNDNPKTRLPSNDTASVNKTGVEFTFMMAMLSVLLEITRKKHFSR